MIAVNGYCVCLYHHTAIFSKFKYQFGIDQIRNEAESYPAPAEERLDTRVRCEVFEAAMAATCACVTVQAETQKCRSVKVAALDSRQYFGDKYHILKSEYECIIYSEL